MKFVMSIIIISIVRIRIIPIRLQLFSILSGEMIDKKNVINPIKVKRQDKEI